MPSDADSPRRSPPLTPSRAPGRAEPDPAAHDTTNPGQGTPPSPPRAGRPLLATAIVLGVVGLDQLTKWWAVRELRDAPIGVIGNDIGFALVVAVVLVRTVRRTRDTLLVVGLSLVLGGAVGNLLDRLFRTPGFLKGAVVDFVHLGDFPTFNVADSAITVGAIALAISLWLEGRAQERAKEAGTAAS